MRLAWEQEVEDSWFAAYHTYRIEVRRAGPAWRRAEVVVYNGELPVVRHECARVEEARAWAEALVEQVEAREAAWAAVPVRPVLMPAFVTA